MKHILILLTALPVMLFAQDASKLKEVTLPQYVPTKKFLDTVNTVWIDSNDWKKGVRFKAWTDELELLQTSVVLYSKAEVMKLGNSGNVVNSYYANQAMQCLGRSDCNIIIEITTVKLRGKPNRPYWGYVVRFR